MADGKSPSNTTGRLLNAWQIPLFQVRPPRDYGVLTTTGRKSGQPRKTPLATLPVDGGFLVVGSNFGKEHHPAWTGNLLATPAATVSFKGDAIPVEARLLDADEKKEVWPQLLRIWPTYDRYVERSGRDIRVFKLERA